MQINTQSHQSHVTQNQTIGNVKIRKRNGAHHDFNANKIIDAIKAAFKSSEMEPPDDTALSGMARRITDSVLFNDALVDGDQRIVFIEKVQDAVELELMKDYPSVAKHYIIYRNEKHEIRAKVNRKNKAYNILSDEFVNSYRSLDVPWGFGDFSYVVFKRTYARTLDEKKGTTEEWVDTIARCVRGAQEVGANYTKEEAERLFDHLFNLRCSFSGRGLWQLGTDTVRNVGMDSLLNCWHKVIKDIDSLIFVIVESMLGGGVGCTVTRDYYGQLPVVKKNVQIVRKSGFDVDHIVSDNKEGWGNLFRKIYESYFITGKGFTFSTDGIRPEGSPIKTFGGIAPGPKPLQEAVVRVCEILDRYANKKCDITLIANLICIGGEMVKSGGIRRTALILIGDSDDPDYFALKNWGKGNVKFWMSNSNNSCSCPDYDKLSDLFWSGYNGEGEPYGLVNIPLCQKFGRLGESVINGFNLVDPSIKGVNPCQPADATVLTPDGISTIGKIKIGDKIWSETGWTTVVNKWSTGVKSVYEYRTSAGVFLGTNNHRVVSNGTKIAVGSAHSIDKLKGNTVDFCEFDEQAVVDGLVIGDGMVHKASNNKLLLCVGAKDTDYFSSKISSHIGEYKPVYASTAYEVDTTITPDECTRTFAREVPARYFYGNKLMVVSFLRGLFSANGSVCGNRVTLKATSRKLINQVQVMLSSVGISSYVTTNQAKTVQFHNGQYVCKDSYDLNISEDREVFANLIGFIQNYKITKLNEIIKNIKVPGRYKGTYEIISTSYRGDEEVFDITVDNPTHTYWTGGLNVSNCAEATLDDGEPCNLAETFLNRIESKEQFLDCVYLLYKCCKAIANGKYFFKQSDDITKKNMRIGIGVTGVCQRLDIIDEWCDYTYRNIRKIDKEYSEANGLAQCIRMTVVKPSGTLSLLSGSTPGVHPGFSKYHLRAMRLSALSPLVPILKAAGYTIEPEQQLDGKLRYDVLVAYFPCKFDGNGVITADNITAIEQLELVKRLQTVWADQAVSVTVYYKPDELPLIKEWLKANYNTSIKTVSFLPYMGHNFAQAPLQSISEEQYNLELSKLKPIGILSHKEAGSEESDKVTNTVECEGGVCPIK